MSTGPDRNMSRRFLAWLWGGLLIVAGLVFMAINLKLITFRGSPLPYVGAGVGLLSLPFLGVWLANRQQWWWLVPAWVFLSIAGLLFVIWLEPPAGQFIAMTVLGEIALPFLLAFLLDRSRWWALIPAYTMLAVSGLLALTMPAISASPGAMVSFILLAIALPFWVVYILDRTRWWALIPAGVLSALAVAFLVFFTILEPGGRLFALVLNAALCLVFLALWLTNRRWDWALWLAAGFLIAAGLSIWFEMNTTWPVVALVMGVYIIFRQLRGPRAARPSAPAKAAAQPPATPPMPAPTTGPAADKAPETDRAPDSTGFRPIQVPGADKPESGDEPPADK